MDSNRVYLGNVSSKCTEYDIYQDFIPFGLIKSIKLYGHYFHGKKYLTGYATIEYQNRGGYLKCTQEKHQIQFQDSVFHIHANKPDTRFELSLFVYYNDASITRESLLDFFMNLRPVDVRIRSEPNYDHLGFAIVEFPSEDLRNMAKSIADESGFQVFIPDRELTTLSSGTQESLYFEPSRIDFLDPSLYRHIMDLEIVHCKTPYRVNSFLAAVQSNRISALLLSNTIINRVETRINYEGPFDLISNFLMYQPVEIDMENAYFVFLLSVDLGIQQLQEKSTELVYPQMTPETALQLYKDLNGIEINSGPHIDFMASHFEEMISNPDFTSLPVEILASIMKSPRFNMNPIKFGNWMRGFVQRRVSDRSRLIQFLPIDLSNRQDTIDLIKKEELNINLLRSPLVDFLHRGLSAQNESKIETIICRQNPAKPGYGIFSTLCDRCCGNPIDYGMIGISSNSNLPRIIDPIWKDAANENPYYSTPDIPNSWIEFDMMSTPIIPSGYTLKSFTADTSLPYMTCWCIEASNDESHWDTLSIQRNMNMAGSERESMTWKIDTSNTYQYIRLRQLERNARGNNCMFLHRIELFGSIPKMSIDCQYEPGKEWNGIFDALLKRVHCNPVEADIIRMKASCDAKNLIDPKWNGCWRSPNEPAGSAITFDFMKMKVQIKGYMLRSHYGPGYPQHWVLEYSDNNVDYLPLDEQKQFDEFDSPYKVCSFTCSNVMKFPARYIRIRSVDCQKSKPGLTTYIFWLSRIELYGDLLRPM